MKNSVEYSVDVSQAENVVEAVRFAKGHNIRFIVKNTGHEYVPSISSHACPMFLSLSSQLHGEVYGHRRPLRLDA